MAEEQFLKIKRDLLYNEIWEISASGVAKKYNVSYADLLRICKEIDIPIPPSGYWMKLSFGKPVEKIQLPESQQSEVILPINVVPKRHKRSSISEDTDDWRDEKKELLENEASEEKDNGQLTYRTVSGEQNVYNREKLYEEVWSKPIEHVALQYGVSDVAIHKVCKALNIPVPPSGYWARIRSVDQQQTLVFLDENERQKILLAAEQIQISDEGARLHKKIAAYRSKVKEWNKNDTKPEGAQRGFKNYSNRPPFLAGVISNETLPRVYRILDAIYRQVEILGGTVNDDLSLTIRNERVNLEICEAQDEIKHELTRQEAQELIIYEDEKRHSMWASKPNIRKYDYVFNGKLRICIRKSRYFRDSEKEKVESRLGDMLIELYEESEVVRKNREAYEEEKRKAEEQKRLREERRIRYNEEVDKTIELTNMAQDYDVACKIRAYISNLESKTDIDNEKTADWIEWAKKKADWFDPTIVRKDELFGEREHGESEDRKALKKSYCW